MSISSIGIIGVSALAASASSGTLNVVTHTSGHADTTSVSGPCTTFSVNGPVWAYDNLSLRYSVTSTGTDTYSVTIHANGSFSAFADPITGACSNFNGSVDGWLTLDVTSSTSPDPAAVPAQENGSLGQSQILTNQLFDGNGVVTGGGSYDYTYTLVDGAKYVQVG
ncbi:MAG: hypothetical protein KGL05_05630 [Acidobacteriota bacterium]|nr:hypothetical protein [Acidobacteriota bacterium]MDE3139297.1 hypothetical protein [Acidobacteriota bacterium]